jgi:hypothetical protein
MAIRGSLILRERNYMIDLFCIASGPSLTASDCELIRESGVKTIAVNNSWQMAPFCNFIYAGDGKWWDEFNDKITIPAERWTCSHTAANVYQINYHIAAGAYNSGMRAIQFGISQGFKNIALLGYDCSLKNGVHWHGPHIGETLRNPNELKLAKWKIQFAAVAKNAKKLGVRVINCSRHTELECFEKMSLEEALNKTS